jgi:hypothetical protein
MKEQWQVTRTTIGRPDGYQRWDLAYQCLLKWAQTSPAQLNEQEAHSHENRDLHAGLDPRTGRNTHD